MLANKFDFRNICWNFCCLYWHIYSLTSPSKVKIKAPIISSSAMCLTSSSPAGDTLSTCDPWRSISKPKCIRSGRWQHHPGERRLYLQECGGSPVCVCRLKQLREEPYSQAEAERAAGMGSYIAPKTVEVKTQPVEENMDWTLLNGRTLTNRILLLFIMITKLLFLWQLVTFCHLYPSKKLHIKMLKF